VQLVRIRSGWNRQGSKWYPGSPPMAVLMDAKRISRHSGENSVASWLDHCYMAVDEETGEQVWVSEPYSLGNDFQDDASLLRQSGFRVDVSPEFLSWRHSNRAIVVVVQRVAEGNGK